MLAGTTGLAAIVAALFTGVVVHPANWLGVSWRSGGLEGDPAGVTVTCGTSTTTLTTVTDLDLCPPCGPCDCPALEPENFRVLGTGATGSTIEVPGLLALSGLLVAEIYLVACTWRLCALRASEARRRQPLGETRLQLR